MEDNNQIVWGLPSRRSTKVAVAEKYDFPVLTVQPRPENAGKTSFQLNLNKAAIALLGIETPGYVMFGSFNNTIVIGGADQKSEVTAKVTGANNISSRKYHNFICEHFTNNKFTEEVLEFRLNNSSVDNVFELGTFSEIENVSQEEILLEEQDNSAMDNSEEVVLEETEMATDRNW